MKELSTEEKAQRYDEAIKIAKVINNEQRAQPFNVMTRVFPELKWDEDEKIRKYILKCCEETIEANDRGLELSMDTTKKLKNWLERQGCVKESVISQHENKTCKENGNSLTSEDEKIREQILSFLKEFAHDHYRSLNFSSWITWLEKQGEPIDKEKVLIGARKDVAMSIINYLDDKSAGMCLSEMERKDIEDALINFKWNNLYNYMKKKLEKQGKQKPAEWSAEDELNFSQAIYVCHQNGYNGVENWLKSLKSRVQPKQEWSEEDEKIYQSIMDDTVQENQLDGKQTDWLRNIKYRNFAQPQNTWKPSEEQMRYLLKYAEQNNYEGAILTSLYEDLKKLKQF